MKRFSVPTVVSFMTIALLLAGSCSASPPAEPLQEAIESSLMYGAVAIREDRDAALGDFVATYSYRNQLRFIESSRDGKTSKDQLAVGTLTVSRVGSEIVFRDRNEQSFAHDGELKSLPVERVTILVDRALEALIDNRTYEVRPRQTKLAPFPALFGTDLGYEVGPIPGGGADKFGLRKPSEVLAGLRAPGASPAGSTLRVAEPGVDYIETPKGTMNDVPYEFITKISIDMNTGGLKQRSQFLRFNFADGRTATWPVNDLRVTAWKDGWASAITYSETGGDPRIDPVWRSLTTDDQKFNYLRTNDRRAMQTSTITAELVALRKPAPDDLTSRAQLAPLAMFVRLPGDDPTKTMRPVKGMPGRDPNAPGYVFDAGTLEWKSVE